jgi:hypothetical protein
MSGLHDDGANSVGPKTQQYTQRKGQEYCVTTAFFSLNNNSWKLCRSVPEPLKAPELTAGIQRQKYSGSILWCELIISATRAIKYYYQMIK